VTIDEFVVSLKTVRDLILKDDPPLKLASYSVLALQSKRIFTDGKSPSGKTFSYESSNEIYIYPSNSPKKLTPKGKPNGKRKVEKINRKMTYFSSYQAYKSYVGRPTGGKFVSFENIGELKSDFENPQSGKKPEPTKIDAHEYQVKLKKEINKLKVENFNSRYDDMFKLSDFEKAEFIRIAKAEFIKINKISI